MRGGEDGARRLWLAACRQTAVWAWAEWRRGGGVIVGERRRLEGERVRGGVMEKRKTEAVGAGMKHI